MGWGLGGGGGWESETSGVGMQRDWCGGGRWGGGGGGGLGGVGWVGIRDTRGRNAERLVWRWAVVWGWGAWRRGVRDTRGRNAERLVWRWAVGGGGAWRRMGEGIRDTRGRNAETSVCVCGGGCFDEGESETPG